MRYLNLVVPIFMLTLFAGGCSFDWALQEGRFLSCDTDLDCPDAMVCRETSIAQFTSLCISIARPSCGNGVQETGEECDEPHGEELVADGSTVPYSINKLCLSDCSGYTRHCSDSNHDPEEFCDAGSANSSSYGSDCNLTCDGPGPHCGDGILDLEEEECDDGNLLDEDMCLATCQVNVCGDGHRNPSMEACDDGNLELEACDYGETSCGTTCGPRCETVNKQTSYCGDGEIEDDQGELCDDGNQNNEDGCLADCTVNICGDGYQNREIVSFDMTNGLPPQDGQSMSPDSQDNFVEACDDGNAITEVCSYGETECGFTCGESCTAVLMAGQFCGDGVIQNENGGDEPCDDGNKVVWDTCHSCVDTGCSLASVYDNERPGWCGPLNGFIAAGNTLSCALTPQGQPTCWGIVSNMGIPRPRGMRQIVVAENFVCGLLEDRTVTCWGDDDSSSAAVVPEELFATTFNSISAGAHHVCGIKQEDSTVACWGAPTGMDPATQNCGQTLAPAGTFLQLASGRYHTCGLRTDHTVSCWGLDTASCPSADSQNEQPNIVDLQTQIMNGIPTTQHFAYIEAGDSFNCGLRQDGFLQCWGSNEDGIIEAVQSEDDIGGARYKSLACGSRHCCAIRWDDVIRCWGNNDNGEATDPAGYFKAVAAGNEHSCGISENDTLSCWGINEFNQSQVPHTRLTTVATGGQHACGLRPDGSITCWGQNDYGQAPQTQIVIPPNLSDEEKAQLTAQDPIKNAFSQLSAGPSHTCGVKLDGQILCWGAGTQAASTENCLVPECGQAAAPEGRFTQVSSGRVHSCGIESGNSTATCWGANGAQQSTVPLRDDGGEHTFIAVATGHSSTCGIRQDNNQLLCWGAEIPGADGPTILDFTPDGEFQSIDCGQGGCCAIDTSGIVQCWNDHESQTYDVGEAAMVTLGEDHICTLGTDGNVNCWGGTNTDNQLAFVNHEYQFLSAGGRFTCGLKRLSNELICWGSNSHNQQNLPQPLYGYVDVVIEAFEGGSLDACESQLEDVSLDLDIVGNDECNPSANTAACLWDQGDCCMTSCGSHTGDMSLCPTDNSQCRDGSGE